jgi:hypothetical protein
MLPAAPVRRRSRQPSARSPEPSRAFLVSPFCPPKHRTVPSCAERHIGCACARVCRSLNSNAAERAAWSKLYGEVWLAPTYDEKEALPSSASEERAQWIRAPLVDRRYESDDNVSVKSANTSMSGSRKDLRYRPLALAPRTSGGIRQAYLQRLGLLSEREAEVDEP